MVIKLQLTLDFTNDFAILYDASFIKFKEGMLKYFCYVRLLIILFLRDDNVILFWSEQLNHIMIYK